MIYSRNLSNNENLGTNNGCNGPFLILSSAPIFDNNTIISKETVVLPANFIETTEEQKK